MLAKWPWQPCVEGRGGMINRLPSGGVRTATGQNYTCTHVFRATRRSSLRREVRRRKELLKGKRMLGSVYVCPSVSLVFTDPGGALWFRLGPGERISPS